MASEEKYLRMTFNERIQHFLLLSYFYDFGIHRICLEVSGSILG